MLRELFEGWPGAPKIYQSGAHRILDALDGYGWKLVPKDETPDANQVGFDVVKRATEGR